MIFGKDLRYFHIVGTLGCALSLDVRFLVCVGCVQLGHGRVSCPSDCERKDSSAAWRACRPQSAASASLFPANRNKFAKKLEFPRDIRKI